jgi:hypothetical protein
MGTALLERFGRVTVTGDLATQLEAFTSTHRALETATQAADEACQLRDAALAVIGTADASLDKSVDLLATRIVGAEMGNRKNPFASFSKHAPGKLLSLAYVTEISEVRGLAAQVAAKGPPEEVTRALGECLQRATEVEQAVVDLSGPQSTYDLKRAARDAAAMDWSKAYAKLRLRSEVAFEDDPETFKALFAEPERVQRPVKRRKAKNEATPAIPD